MHPLVSWFYPGSLEGHEFLYSPRREQQIENSVRVIVAANGSSDVPVQNPCREVNR